MMIEEQSDVGRRIHDCNHNRTSFCKHPSRVMLVHVLARATHTRAFVLSPYGRLGFPHATNRQPQRAPLEARSGQWDEATGYSSEGAPWVVVSLAVFLDFVPTHCLVIAGAGVTRCHSYRLIAFPPTPA